jgi:hypothetical protein
MYNVEFVVEGVQLIIRIDLNQELGVSSSGKSVIIATTGGNVEVPGWEAVKVGLNVYRPQQADRSSRHMASQKGKEGEGMAVSVNTTADALIDAVNVHLEAGNWSHVVDLTATLYGAAVESGDVQLAELVQDLHWIAHDALAHPLNEVMVVQS